MFRWRGENVSTIEVESVISSVLEQADSVVYGVDVPGVEGKAGMAAIVEEAGKFDLERFLNRIRAELPAYAIPLFIRLVSTIDITGKVIYGVPPSGILSLSAPRN
jgi:solute carrier family 27 fatty acid transporter 1/4